MQVNLNDVIAEIENANVEFRSFYNKNTGEFVSDADTDVEDDAYIALPDSSDRNDYGLMQSFINTVEDDTAYDWLTNAIQGRGAFRRFRGACEKFYLLQDWYNYRDQAIKDLAINWCEDHGLVWDDQANQEIDEDDVSDFYHDDFKEEEEEDIVEKVESIRYTVLTERNYDNAIYLVDEALQYFNASNSNLDEAKEQLEEWIAQKEMVIVASEHGRYVGLLFGQKCRDFALVDGIYVYEDMRRKGIGSKLLKEFKENTNVDEIRIEIKGNSHKSQKFFERNGYVLQPVLVMKKEY